MQSERPKRGQRVVQHLPELGVPINNFKDFISSKLEFTLPQNYGTMSIDQKKETWRQLLNKLKNQTQKLSYQLPDSRTLQQVNMIIQIVKEESQSESLDCEYEEMFFGNKKQLVVFKKCKEMTDYLEKYRLPKPFENSLKDLQSIAKSLFDLKVKRNISLSLQQKEQVDKISAQIKGYEEKFDKAFQKFQDLMKKILEHFKGQKKRLNIYIEPLREGIYERLKPLVQELDLNIYPRYHDVDNDEFLSIQISKKSQFDRYFDEQLLKDTSNQKPEQEQQCHSDTSSYVSDLSDEEKQLQIEQKIKKALPPAGVYSVSYKKYQNRVLTLTISFQTARNKWESPNSLEYTDDQQNYKWKTEINVSSKDIDIEIQIQKGGPLSFFFRTRNLSGYSTAKNFKYLLCTDQSGNLIKNGLVLFIGQNKILIPAQRSKKEGDIHSLNLAVCEFSMSSTQVGICDSDGNAADWGLFKLENQQKQEVVEQNNVFQVVNNKDNMYYQEPAIRLEKSSYKIIKTSCGSGYCLMLDAYGAVWAFGKNHCGQLAIKNQLFVEDAVKIKFFEEKKIFITDIKGSESLASFAIDSNGTLYKWGVNQFHETNLPIFDRFGKLINYSLESYLSEQYVPISVKKHFATEKIVQIQAGNEFYLMLNNEGTLYGWGQCRNLGKGVFKDGKDEEIENICIEIELLKDVSQVSAGRNHAIVSNKEGKVLAWGNMEYLCNKKKDFSETVIDLTEEYGLIEPEDKIVCGPNYTCLYKAKEHKIKLYGDTQKFPKAEYQIKQKVRKIECGQEVIGIMVEK